jgi:hypothetical protein
MSQQKAGLEFGVPRSTLRHRINGRISRQEAHIPQQRLSEVQEERLTEWVLTQESLGLGPTYGQIRAFAGRILRVRGDNKPLGKRWIDSFLRQNLILKTKR